LLTLGDDRAIAASYVMGALQWERPEPGAGPSQRSGA